MTVFGLVFGKYDATKGTLSIRVFFVKRTALSVETKSKNVVDVKYLGTGTIFTKK